MATAARARPPPGRRGPEPPSTFSVPAILTGPPPDPILAGGNDTLATFFFGNVSSGGLANRTETDIISVERTTADEDKPPIPNPDELQMRVELQPLLPVSTARNSEIVKIDLP